MAPLIGHLLPLALGVALSSVPIVVMVLILLSPRGRWSGLAYLLGAVSGLTGLTVLFTAVASLLPPPPSAEQSPLFGGIEIAIGAALLLLAVIRLVRSRRAHRSAAAALSPLDELASLDDAPPPGATRRWMDRITTLGPLPSLGVGFVLMLRPKNLLLTMAAGVAIAAQGASIGETVVGIAVFVVLGISTLAAPIIVAVSDPARTRRPLEQIHLWIDRNSATVTTVVLLVLGTVIIGSGLTRL